MKKHPDFPNYLVTKDGKVWSKKRTTTKGGWLSPGTSDLGYLQVVLCEKGQTHNRFVHRLVLETYVGPCPEGMVTRHLDGNPANNKLSNVCWGTQSENILDAVRQGTFHNNSLGKFGEKHHSSKISDQDRRLIYNSYHDGGCTQRELAGYFGMAQSSIGHITRDNRWGPTCQT